MSFKSYDILAFLRPNVVAASSPAYLFSRSGMVRFLLMKHIFRLMTFRSLGEAPQCLGDPESSLPLQLGDWARAPSHGRSATRDGFLKRGETSRMYLTAEDKRRRRNAV